MAFTHSITRVWTSGAFTISKKETLTADGETNRDIVAYSGQTTVMSYNLTVAGLQSFYLVSAGDVTATPYDQSSNPLAAIELLANSPFVWSIGSGLENPFSDDLSEIRFVNAGANASVSLRSLHDSTEASPVGS